MRKGFILFFTFLLQGLMAQTARHYSNEFLNIGVDAKSMAMGNAVIANANNGTAGYWNPAGLTAISGRQINLMHAAYFANIAQYDYLSYANTRDNRTNYAISLIRFGVDNIMNTTQLIDGQGNINYDRITYFSAADYAFYFSAGRKNVLKSLSLGITAKLIYRHIGDFAQGFGFGFDLGAQYQLKKWRFGLMLRDITTTFNYWSVNKDRFDEISQAIPGHNQSYPNDVELTLPKIQVGTARKFHLKQNLDLLAEIDLNARFFKMHSLISSDFISLDPAAGIEFTYYKMAFIRLGVNNFRNEEFFGEKQIKFQPNAGLGFKYKSIGIDYALTNIGSDGFYSHVFSLSVDLDRFLGKDKK